MTIDVNKITNINTLVQKAKWLEGKTLAEVAEKVKEDDKESRVSTKAAVGYVIEQGFFGSVCIQVQAWFTHGLAPVRVLPGCRSRLRHDEPGKTPGLP